MIEKPRRIFIVEDEILVAFEMTDTLEDLGFEVVGPSVHLEDAKRKAEEDDIDIAFLDVNFGQGLTSQPVAEILRQRGIPFVFVTGYDPKEISFLMEGDQVIRKPASPPKILSCLSTRWPDIKKV